MLAWPSLAILSAVFAAIANVMARTLLRNTAKGSQILGVNFGIMALMLLCFVPLYFEINFEPRAFATIIPTALLLIVIVGGVDFGANLFYFKAFEKCDASTVTNILALQPVGVFVLGWVLIGETPGTLKITVALLITFLILFLTRNSTQPTPEVNLSRLHAFIATGLMALSGIPTRILLSEDFTNPATLYLLRAVIIALLGVALFGTVSKLSLKEYLFISSRGIVVIAQWLLLYAALTKGEAGLVYTLASIAPAFTVAIAYVALREKVTAQKILAAALILLLAFTLKYI